MSPIVNNTNADKVDTGVDTAVVASPAGKDPSSGVSMSAISQKRHWRSLEHLAETPEFKKIVEREFPEGASELTDPVSRRKFLGIMGASMALAGLASCRRPVQKIVPYVVPPEDLVPGMPQYYATAMPFGLSSYGLLVESHEGRPTKIEGNTLHPSSLGSTTAQMQAMTLALYDPDRVNAVTLDGVDKTWDDFVGFWRGEFSKYKKVKGRGVAIITGSHNSPSMAKLAKRWKKKFPQASWVTYESVSDENIHNGIANATGKNYLPKYQFDKADVVLSLDSDFLQRDSESLRSSRGFADRRRVSSVTDSMNRLYAVESMFTLTGGMADHRLRVPSSEIAAFALALAGELKNQGLSIVGLPAKAPAFSAEKKKWLSALAKDLLRSRGKSLVVAGRRQPSHVHSLVLAINNALGNIGKTVEYHAAPDALFPNRSAFVDLVAKMKSGEISTLIIAGGNPVYDAPSDLHFADALKRVSSVIRLGDLPDETARVSNWVLPLAHFLESWGDTRAVDGTIAVTQPLIEPLMNGRSVMEVVSLLLGGRETPGYEIVRSTLRGITGKANFEAHWERMLHDGVLAGSATSSGEVKLKSDALKNYPVEPVSISEENLEIVFYDGNLFDGRLANVGWLQELPDPVTKLTWDNAALVSPATARHLHVKNSDVVTISVGGKSLEAPVWVMPGQADNSLALALGYGRSAAGTVGSGVGVDVSPLRTFETFDFADGVTVGSTGTTYELVSSQDHGSMEDRPIIREATLEEYRKEPRFAPEMVETPPLGSMWNDIKYDTGYQWGMAIDLNVCTGCNACTIACQSENNVPIVGKEQVGHGREMHWLRMDRYFIGDEDDPQMAQQPMACQQCEMAPCEQVCPVAATNHDKEGLNVMVYNRCIGTRYCSNNCPYKVRRFNFFNYTKDTPELVKMAMNPDVTVRSRGVMEKCTYCTQRIARAKLGAKLEDRKVKDGEIVSACQQACPTKAIVFGNINDPESEVSKVKLRNLNYEILAEINTRPRTSFQARLRNPNPELPHTVVEG